MQAETVSSQPAQGRVRIGCSGWQYKHWRELFDERLLSWSDWILAQARSGRSVWCYFNNDIAGHAIEDAQTLKSMVGQMLLIGDRERTFV